MRPVFLGFIMAMTLFHGIASACSILNPEKIQIGSHKAIRGVCSNNGMRISCMLIEGFGIECDGPSGGYTGSDLDSLIFSACGCSIEQEKELQLKKELGKNNRQPGRGGYGIQPN